MLHSGKAEDEEGGGRGDDSDDDGEDIDVSIFDENVEGSGGGDGGGSGAEGPGAAAEGGRGHTASQEEKEVTGFVERLEEHTRVAAAIQLDLEKKIRALLEDGDHEEKLRRIRQEVSELKADAKRLRRLFALGCSVRTAGDGCWHGVGWSGW